MSKNKAVFMDQIYLVIIILNSSSNFQWTLVKKVSSLSDYFQETVPASLLSDVRLILFQDCSHFLKYFHYICLPDCCRGKDKRTFRIWHLRTIARNTSINFWNTFSHVRFNHFVVLEKEPYNSAEMTAQFSCNERIMKP